MDEFLRLQGDIRSEASEERAKVSQRFFKTGKGEYGEGDIFVGLTVPAQRKIAVKYKNLPYPQIKKLLQSKVHEERLIALLILVHNFKSASEDARSAIVDFYLENTGWVNNWDLVDLSADKILGEYLVGKGKGILLRLASSKSIWERRIAVIATYAFIKRGESEWTFKIAERLLHDKNDLIEKAVGWMLREVGKRVSVESEEEFLRKHYRIMGRTALRYAIERFGEEKRRGYLLGRI